MWPTVKRPARLRRLSWDNPVLTRGDIRMRRLFVTAVAAAALVAPVLGHSAPPAQPPAGQAPAGQAPANAQAQPQRPPQAPLGPNEWAIDGSHSAANFSVRHNVVSTVRGKLGQISGKIEYDGKDVKTVKADVSIDMQ